MKYFKHPLAYTILSFCLLVATSAFTIFSVNYDAPKDRDRILQQLFVTEFHTNDYTAEDIAKYYPDTTLLFSNPYEEANDNQTNSKYVLQYFSGLPRMYNITAAMFNNSNGYFPSADFTKNFIAAFGVSPEGNHVTMKQKYYDSEEHKQFYFYSSQGIKAAFAKLYTKPTTQFETISYQKLYNLSAKKYVRDFVKLMSYLHTVKKQEWTSGCANYLLQAKTNKDFNPFGQGFTVMKKLFPTEKSKQQFPAFTEYLSVYTIGPLIRRQCDGTLPTILSCLKTVLKDYDPEALKLVKGF